MKAKKDTKQLLFENMAKLNPDFKMINEIVFDDVNLNSVKVGGESFEKIKRDFPGHAKSVNPIDSPQYKWYKEVFDFMDGEYNNVFEKAELVKFFQNNFLGMDYGVLQTPAETVGWWLSPEHQEFIKGEMNAEGNSVSEDDMGIEPEQGAPIKYRADVTGVRENVWSTNAMEYDTEEEAKEWLKGLAGRWFGYDMSRVVPTTVPKNQPVDMQNDVIFQNFRKMNESPMFGGQRVSQDQYDELQYDKSTMEKAMGDAFKTPEGYQMKHPVKGGESIQLKDGDVVKVMGIDQSTGNIKVRVVVADEESKKYYKNGYFDIMWTPVQFDTIVGSEPINEDSDFQQKIANGDVWLEHYGPSGSSEYTDGETWYNRSGQQLRDPEEYNPHSDGYTPFGDESVNKLAENRRIKKDKKTLLFENIVKLNPDLKLNENGGLSEATPMISEDINIDVEVGDTIMMGKFKNSPTVVKSIGKDEHGMPTINGKKAVTFRKATEKNKT